MQPGMQGVRQAGPMTPLPPGMQLPAGTGGQLQMGPQGMAGLPPQFGQFGEFGGAGGAGAHPLQALFAAYPQLQHLLGQWGLPGPPPGFSGGGGPVNPGAMPVGAGPQPQASPSGSMAILPQGYQMQQQMGLPQGLFTPPFGGR